MRGIALIIFSCLTETFLYMPYREINYKDVPHASVRELAFKISSVDDELLNPNEENSKAERKPRFAFFLGAGASYKSGIKLASQMMEDFKERIFERDCPDLKTKEEREKWLEEQSWYCDAENKYSCLFERYDDNKIGRQRYIERLLRNGKPSFGYLMLSYLLANNYVNTVLTTNFDDLAYISCVGFTGIRPIVYAYGILASEMRLYSARPKIIKIHGDFLYGKIINTSEEMERMFSEYKLPVQNSVLIDKLKEITSLDFNMTQETRRVLNEYGLIVVGYSGNDKTVLKMLDDISLQNDFYWCYRKQEPPNQKVLQLVLEKGGKLIAIDGFDEMMSDIEKVISLKPDKLFSNFDTQKENVIIEISKYNPGYIKNFVSEVVEEDKPETEKAESNSQENAEVSSSDWVKLFYQALDAQNKDKNQEAEKLYKRVIALNSKHTDSYYNLGLLLETDKSRAAEAEQCFRKAIELKPNDVNSYDKLAFLIANDPNRLAEAEQYYRKLIEINPDYALAHYNLGVLLARNESTHEEAEKCYRRAIELDPEYADAYHSLGLLLANYPSRFSEAADLYKQAIKINPNHANAHNNLGAIFFRDKSLQPQAEQCYRTAIKIDPNLSVAYGNLGVLLAGDETRLDEAEECYRKAIELAPHDGFAYFHLIFLMRYRKGNLAALEICEQALSNDVKDIDIFLFLAAFYKSSGDRETSVLYADEAQKLMKDDDWFALACLYSILDEKDEALKYLELAVKKDSLTKESAKTHFFLEEIRNEPKFIELVGAG